MIIGYSNLLLDTLDETHEFRPDVEEIRRAGERASDLVKQLLAFSRRQVQAPRVVDLGATLVDMQRVLHRLLGEGIQVTQATTNAGYIYADPSSMEQVILNLALNARDAMPDGGSLTIATESVEIGSGAESPVPGALPGRYCRLRMSDTGVGMDAATRERIFEPFFTTKAKGKGTGLGLATVFGIVAQSQGHITVQSTPRQGTTFDIYLPTTDKAPESRRELELASVGMSGSETVLLVEDDAQVRGLLQTILMRQGYDVLVAANGDEALQLSEQHPAPIELLLTDVVMPNMNGFQLGERMTALRPELAVIYMSGYADHPMLRRESLQEEIEYLQKPIAPEPLLRRVREVLDRAARGARA